MPEAQAEGKQKVDTKWERRDRAGRLKCRLVGRDFKWLEERDDLYAPGSTAGTSRVIDILSLKDGGAEGAAEDDPEEMVTFVGDCCSAYYQTPEEGEFYADPPKEWMLLRE